MKKPSGKYLTIGGEQYYEIRHYDAMQPFFISLASDTDLWMYLSSTGGLTCGRRSPDYALFPYYTDDKITQNYTFTGPRTMVRVHKDDKGKVLLVEPFGVNNDAIFEIERRVLKSVTGNSIVFEEKNLTAGLLFRYSWQPAGQYGWVRTMRIENIAPLPQEFEFIDGVQNVLPSGVNRQTQNVYSTLVDGYKKTELVPPLRVGGGLGLCLFRMEAIMVDKAEPSESLRCNTVYSIGADDFTVLTSSGQLEAFRHGGTIRQEPESKGVQGAYLLYTQIEMKVGESREWMIVMDVEKDACEVRQMLHDIAAPDHGKRVREAIDATTKHLRQIVAHNDGVQVTGDEAQDARHFANVLFNTMRGGFYAGDYTISGKAFADHVRRFNKAVYAEHEAMLTALPEQISYDSLEERVIDTLDHQLHRLFLEYLPLTFSRRHGDPSRPWNSFDIKVTDTEGKPLIAYQGNWRDIFQNWEALSASYPKYLNNIIAKFLNATTADGYNPYRITSEGIDWEVINKDDPWSNIGYWGDHQIIYLSKLIEQSRDHDRSALLDLLRLREFTFAAVPYRIKSYKEIVAAPKDTIRFDQAEHERIFALLPDYGADAKLLMDKDGMPMLVTGAEKILIPLLTKLYNHIPGAGVWMNTLRPEWNDANNALVGNGASMVTVCYIHRYMQVLRDLFVSAEDSTYAVHREVVELMRDMQEAMLPFAEQPIAFSQKTLRAYTDAVGEAGERFREAAYKGFAGEKVELDAQVIALFLQSMLRLTEYSIRQNKREDGLYHAYNLVRLSGTEVETEHLYEMLEGQVAVLSAKILSAEEVVALLDAMRLSALYREDQQSYMLYPNRRRPSFLEMNNVDAAVKQEPEYQELLKAGVLLEDCEGGVHFNADYRNAGALHGRVGQLYEQTFHHHSFTGRSGTFYKYEGLGSIYWHMVSKLLLAVGEVIQAGGEQGLQAKLISHYRAIKEGIGAHKSPEVYGSFPFDAYSHTPAMAGVQQPGMTGQVKEDILSRWMELGIRVHDGQISIDPLMLRREDFREGELRFTYCGTEFVYQLAESSDGLRLSREESAHIFARDGKVKQVVAKIGMTR